MDPLRCNRVRIARGDEESAACADTFAQEAVEGMVNRHPDINRRRIIKMAMEECDREHGNRPAGHALGNALERMLSQEKDEPAPSKLRRGILDAMQRSKS
jgi:hypothetical protein